MSSVAIQPDRVIRRGPYRAIRHPMYVAVLLFISTAVLSHLLLFTVAVGTIVTGGGGKPGHRRRASSRRRRNRPWSNDRCTVTASTISHAK